LHFSHQVNIVLFHQPAVAHKYKFIYELRHGHMYKSTKLEKNDDEDDYHAFCTRQKVKKIKGKQYMTINYSAESAEFT
jgi:hypothetical protein